MFAVSAYDHFRPQLLSLNAFLHVERNAAPVYDHFEIIAMEYGPLVDDLVEFQAGDNITTELNAALQGSLKLFGPEPLNETHALVVHLVRDDQEVDKTIALDVIGAQPMPLTDLGRSVAGFGKMAPSRSKPTRGQPFADSPTSADEVPCACYLVAHSVTGRRAIGTYAIRAVPTAENDEWEDNLKRRLRLSAKTDTSGTSERQRARIAEGVSAISSLQSYFRSTR